MIDPFYKNELSEIYLGDCYDLMYLADRADLLLTDPPYGVGVGSREFYGSNGKVRLKGKCDWDISADSVGVMNWVRAVKRSIIWGGNFFGLPAFPCWLVWDKAMPNYKGADGELAWTNLKVSPKIFRMTRADANINKRIFKKSHPAEKPLDLMTWCLSLVKPAPSCVIDPFMGVGTTLLAATILGIRSIGIEREEKYVNIAVEHFEEMKKMGGLFS